jgi:hypothetical protein
MIERRELLGLAGALAVHAVAFPLLAAVHPAGQLVQRQEFSVTQIDLETTPDPPPAPAAPEAESTPFEGAGAHARASPQVATRIGPGAPAAVMAQETPPTPPAEAPGADTFDPGSVAWMGNAPPPMRGRAANTAGERVAASGTDDRGPDPGRDAARIEGVIRNALVSRDHALGLDAAGALVAMAEDCVRGGDTPLDGRAYFEVTVRADGTVADARLVAASGPPDAWRAAAAKLVAAGAARSVLTRKNGKPLRVRLEVSSRWVLPSGSRQGKPFTTPGVKGYESWTSDTGEHAVELAPTIAGASTGFDVSDIGAKPLRDVHARILQEEAVEGAASPP